MKGIISILCFLLIYCLCATSSIKAQSTITGKVRLENDEVGIGAFVSLVSIKDSLSPIDFAISDEKGAWFITTDVIGDVILKAAYLGYNEYLQKIAISTGDSLYYEISLEKNPLELQQVEVVAKTIDILQKGDTLRFNLKNKVIGGNETLGDVLEKLPGFEIDENNQIKYNGQKIDKLLIEGKDILKDQHQLASEGVNADDLLAVDIIHHYTDKKSQFSSEIFDKIALNIDLDNKNKAIWSGSIVGGLGNKKKFNIAENLIGIGTNYGLTIFGKGNNTGQPVITAGDYMSLQSPRTLLQKLNQASDLENIIPPSLTIPQDLKNNTDWLVAVNSEYSASDALQMKISVSGAKLSRFTASQFNRNYIDENLFFNGNQQQDIDFPFLNIQSNLQYQWKQKVFLEVDFPFSIQKEKRLQTWTGVFNQNTSNISQSTNEVTSNIFPRLYLDYKINEKTHLLWKASVAQNRMTNDVGVTDINTLFNTNEFMINQSITTTNRLVSNELSFFREIGHSRFGIDASYVTHRQKLDIKASPEVSSDFTGSDILDLQTTSVSPFWRFKSKKWRLRANMKVIRYSFSFNGKPSASNLINPEFSVRYNFSKLNFLFFSFLNQNTVVDLPNITRLSQIEDGQTITQGGLQTDILPLNQTFTIGYVNYNISSRTLLNAIISTSRTTNAISKQISNEERFAKIQSIIQPQQSNITGQLTISKPIFAGTWKLRYVTKYQHIESTILQNEQSDELKYQRFFLQFVLRSISKHVLSYQLGLSFSLQSQDYQRNENINNRFSTIRPKVSLTYNQDNWVIKNTLSIPFQGNDKIKLNGIINWDFELTYAPKTKPYSISIIGNNILNGGNQQQAQLSFTPVFIDSRVFNTFPGFFLIQGKYRI